MPGYQKPPQNNRPIDDHKSTYFAAGRRVLSRSYPPKTFKRVRRICLRGPGRPHSNEDPFANFQLLSRSQPPRNASTLPVQPAIDKSFSMNNYWRSLGLASHSESQAAIQSLADRMNPQSPHTPLDGPVDYFNDEGIHPRDIDGAPDGGVPRRTEARSSAFDHHTVVTAWSLHYSHDRSTLRNRHYYEDEVTLSAQCIHLHEMMSYNDDWVHVGCMDQAPLGRLAAHRDSIVIAVGGAIFTNGQWPMLFAASVYFSPELDDLNGAHVLETEHHEPATRRTAVLASIYMALESVEALRGATPSRLPLHLRHVVLKLSSKEVHEVLTFWISVWQGSDARSSPRPREAVLDRTVIDIIDNLINRLNSHGISVQFRLVPFGQNQQATGQARTALRRWMEDVEVLGAPSWAPREPEGSSSSSPWSLANETPSSQTRSLPSRLYPEDSVG